MIIDALASGEPEEHELPHSTDVQLTLCAAALARYYTVGTEPWLTTDIQPHSPWLSSLALRAHMRQSLEDCVKSNCFPPTVPSTVTLVFVACLQVFPLH